MILEPDGEVFCDKEQQILVMWSLDLEDWSEQLPSSVQFIIADEQSLVAVDHVQNQPLVGVWKVCVVSGFVCEVQLTAV